MMKIRTLAAVVVLLAGLASGEPALGACKLVGVPLPVTMMGRRPLLPAKINGQEAMFMIDSGAFFGMITPASASKFNLPEGPLPFGASVAGTTGVASARVGTVDVFTLADTPIHRLQFIVTGGEIGEGAAGVIGQNVLGRFDVDYDLARGSVRLMSPENCGDANLAYWAGDKPYSVIPLEDAYGDRRTHHTLATVYLNGVRLIALLDTGAPTSLISLRAAERAGVTSHDQGVSPAGRSGGIGARTLPVWLGKFTSFKIGGEEIRNEQLMFGGLDLENADMILGADFFLSHHLLVSNSQRKLYFTYNGGPVFMRNQKPLEVWGDAEAQAPKETANDPTDAAGFALRGAASTSRGDFNAAIADLSRALDLSPTRPDYLYERGRAYLGAGRPLLALADFNTALTLKPDDVPALVLRAELKLREHDKAAALEDLDSADRVSAKQDDVHLQLGQLYVAAGALPAAILQDDLWIAAHPEASETPLALNRRCWARALLGRDLEKALADCNRALSLAPKTAMMLDSRGLTHLRRGEFDDAIRDYDSALAQNPKLGWSLYGRGLAERRKGETAASETDIAAAVAINPKLQEEVIRYGIDPPTQMAIH